MGLPEREREKKEKERERERERERTFPMKSSNLRHSLSHSQNKGLSNTRGELANCGLAHSQLEAERQAGNSQSQDARGNLGPRDPPPNCEQAPSC